MTDPVTVVIPGIPQGKARARFTGAGNVYTPGKTAAYESAIGMLARASMRGREPMTGPLHMEMRAVMPIPRSWSREKTDAAILGEIRPTCKPDIDNILKAVADGLNKIVYPDDAAIVSTTLSKVYGQQSFVVVTVKPISIHRVPEKTKENAEAV